MKHPDTSEGTQDVLRLLTVNQVAEKLGCSRNHVYRLISIGVLPAVDIAAPKATRSKTRIHLDDLAKYIASARTVRKEK